MCHYVTFTNWVPAYAGMTTDVKVVFGMQVNRNIYYLPPTTFAILELCKR